MSYDEFIKTNSEEESKMKTYSSIYKVLEEVLPENFRSIIKYNYYTNPFIGFLEFSYNDGNETNIRIHFNGEKIYFTKDVR